MKETIKKIKDLAKATDNLYLLHYIERLEIEIKIEILDTKIKLTKKNI